MIDIYAVASMFVLLLLSGTFSGSETALFSLNQGDIGEVAKNQHRSDGLIMRLLGDERNLLLTILIANNAVNICYFSIAAWWMGSTHYFQAYPEIILPISLAAIILCGEIFPKVFASSNALSSARVLSYPTTATMFICTPLVAIFQKLLGHMIVSENAIHPSQDVTNDELRLVIEESHKHGVVSDLIHDRLIEVIDLSETPVSQVMTHRVDCPAIDVDASKEEAIEAFKDNPGPFMIVYDPDKNEECVGVLGAQDLLKDGKVSKRMRKPLFIPGGALLPKAIALFQDNKKSAGVVVDEYGGTAGLLTLAHIGQELLGSGDHEDLPDIEEPRQINNNTWLLSGQTPLEGWETLIDEEDLNNAKTIGGFVTWKLGSVPEVGDRLLYSNLLFKVESVDGHRIKQLSLEQLSALEARRTTRNMEHI